MPKCLMFDHGGVLDGEMVMAPDSMDLVLSGPDEGVYNVLKNGVSIINDLNDLIKNHGYKIIFHSKNLEEDQLRILEQLRSACRKKNIEFPTVFAMGVCDARPEKDNAFKNNSYQNPLIITNRSHGIKIAAYSDVTQSDSGKSYLRAALSKLFVGTDQMVKSECIVFDDGDTVFDKAKEEGYQAFYISGQNKGSRQAYSLSN